MLKLLFGTKGNLVVCQTAALSAESMVVQRPGPISTEKLLQPMWQNHGAALLSEQWHHYKNL
jgi:hypothetical protein